MKSNESSKFMSTVKVGPKGQIVIPKDVREMFGIQTGDSLLLLADTKKGIAIQKMGLFSKIADMIFEGKGHEINPDVSEEDLDVFAQDVKNAEKGYPTKR